jgi:hypothetical protein
VPGSGRDRARTVRPRARRVRSSGARSGADTEPRTPPAEVVRCHVPHHDLFTFGGPWRHPRPGRCGLPDGRTGTAFKPAAPGPGRPARSSAATREQHGPGVGGDADRVEVHTHLVDKAGELPDLCRGVELGLVADQVVHPPAAGDASDDDVLEVEAGDNLKGARGQTRRADSAAPPARSCLVNISPAPPEGVAVVHLEGQCGPATVLLYPSHRYQRLPAAVGTYLRQRHRPDPDQRPGP